MGENKWTPGPWRLDGNTDGNFYGISAHRDGHRGEAVVVWRGIARPCSPNGRANARLIAAAPMMAEALEELRRVCADIPAIERNPRFAKANQAALAALSSARGED